MRVEEIMHRPVVACSPGDHLGVAARLMWEKDCGALPVVDGDGRVIAMITDRDICMAALTQGLCLEDIPVQTAMSRQIHACRPEDQMTDVHSLMGDKQIRRVPVVDGDHHLVGILSINDMTRNVARPTNTGNPTAKAAVIRTLAEVGAPHHGPTHEI